MFFSKAKLSSSQYAPLAIDPDGEETIRSPEKRSISEDDDSSLSLIASNNLPTLAPSKLFQLPKIVVYLSFALALLSAANVALLNVTLAEYQAYPFSDSELEALPLGDARLGLNRAAGMLAPSHIYQYSWADRIARVSRKLKSTVWGQGVQVYVTVEDSTIMRFPIPSPGTNACAVTWSPPLEFSARTWNFTTKGDITEMEIWQLIAPSPASAVIPSGMDELDYDTLSYSTLPVRGELLGVLDLTVKLNSTTLEFACPSEAQNLIVEMRCQRVACHLSYNQLDVASGFGFGLARRQDRAEV